MRNEANLRHGECPRSNYKTNPTPVHGEQIAADYKTNPILAAKRWLVKEVSKALPVVLHFAASSGRLHVTTPGVADDISFEAPLSTKALSSRDKVRAHRKRLRARGLRPIQVWVPDTRTATFKVEAHRQSLVVAQSPHARRDQHFIDTISIEAGD